MSTDGIVTIDRKYLHAPAGKMAGCARTHKHTDTQKYTRVSACVRMRVRTHARWRAGCHGRQTSLSQVCARVCVCVCVHLVPTAGETYEHSMTINTASTEAGNSPARTRSLRVYSSSRSSLLRRPCLALYMRFLDVAVLRRWSSTGEILLSPLTSSLLKSRSTAS